MGDWDGSEDNVADHSGKIDDLSATFTKPSQVLTRVAISEHTIANGFPEDIAYYGDSLGNVTVVHHEPHRGLPDAEQVHDQSSDRTQRLRQPQQ